MDQRLQFVAEYLTGLYSMTELAASYGVSRRIGYYWVNRYQRDGHLDALSRRPHTSPAATPAAIIDRICDARRAHPTWGAGKLRTWLCRHDPRTAWPCRDTMHEVLRRRGLIRQRVRRRHLPRPPLHLTTATQPNALWTADYKGEFRTGNGEWCYPFTLRDARSRYVLRCTALGTHTYAATYAEFVHAFRAYGLPARIRTDNGPPFGGPGLGRLSRLAVWWLRLGVEPERITPGRPEQNGSHEQFHAVLKRETARPPAASRPAQQRRFRTFVSEYNEQRPHAALNGACPAGYFSSSPRAYPEILPTLEYPAAWTVRRVAANGSIKWRSLQVFLSHVLGGNDVAFEPIDDGLWVIRFATLPLARFDERRGLVLPLLKPSGGCAGPLGI